jgi:hypothetical protein
VELGEQVRDRALNLLVRVLDDVAVSVVNETDRQRVPQLTALGCCQFRAVQPTHQEVQLNLLSRLQDYGDLGRGAVAAPVPVLVRSA